MYLCMMLYICTRKRRNQYIWRQRDTKQFVQCGWNNDRNVRRLYIRSILGRSSSYDLRINYIAYKKIDLVDYFTHGRLIEYMKSRWIHEETYFMLTSLEARVPWEPSKVLLITSSVQQPRLSLDLIEKVTVLQSLPSNTLDFA